MTHSPIPSPLRRQLPLLLLLMVAAGLLGRPSSAQVPNRIAQSFSTSDGAPLQTSLHPLARAEFDQGRASSVTKVPYMTLVFSPSAAQKAALTTLLADQQNSASPSYHQWLTPAQFGARFGMSDQDLATTETWLQAQGFTVLDVNHGRDAIHFSGTVAQVESAFHTEMHQYAVQGETHLANSTVLSLPSALAGTVAGIRGVSQFRPHPMHTAVRRPSAESLKADYTASNSDHYLSPNDIATIYDVKALYNAGFDGTGQSIAIVGQSAISTTDLDAFRSAAGLAAKEPTLVLVPNTGTSTVYSGDEGESDIDLEWSGATAKNATVYFVYVGSNQSASVFDAMEYAIDNKTAPIISVSYGVCEVNAGSDPSTLEPYFMKANAQGQTLLASSGDAGATGCDSGTTATHGLSVSYPASSAYLTAMGGTQFNEGTGSYWNTTSDSGGGSAKSYIPEVVWNETSVSNAQTTPGGLTSGGGGKSILFGKPSWQVATGVPADAARDVPDISLNAAVYHDGFLYCSEGSCTSGFASSTNTLTVAGGTSFDAPIFAGILAMINQKNGSTGAGNINADLYSLYGTYASVFHDITTGDNKQPCTSGSIDCPAGATQTGYSAGAGYDLASGLGSIDAYNLAQIFPTLTTAVGGSVTTLSASSSSPVTGTAVTFTAAVTASSGTASPTGSVNFVVNGGAPVTVSLSSGTASYAATFSTTGTQTITATYSGDANYATSTSSLTITVASSSSTGSFKLSATSVTVTSGNSVNSTVTVTAASGYSGVVGLGYTVSPTFTGCLFADSIGVGSNGTVSSTITVDTLASDCTSTGARNMLKRITPTATAATRPDESPRSRGQQYPIAAATVLAGLFLLGRKRKAWPVAMVLMLAGLGTLSGCGGSSSTSGTTTSTTTYTFTLTGTDSVYSTVTASTTFTATVK